MSENEDLEGQKRDLFTQKEISPEELKKVNAFFSGSCDFIAGVDTLDRMMSEGEPEIAFAGRSNVGKSSLINALTKRKTLARVSHTPGRTQQLNFFLLNERLRLVDLPGYGYARASKTKISTWNKVIKSYLKGRVTLRRVCILIDSRHGFKESDIEVMDLLDSVAVQYQIVMTKMDKVKRPEFAKRKEEMTKVLKKHTAAFPLIHGTSSHKGWGIEELQYSLYGLREV